jgi:3-oxo-5-alpha-steroid 4-dehydrogenase 1
MGRTSIVSKANLPGRYAWAAAEIIGPINLLFILFTLPSKLKPQPESATSVLGTGLPVQHEILGLLYIVHYANRAVISPLLLAPSMSPIHATVTAAMSLFQFMNSSIIACWIVYAARDKGGENTSLLLSLLSVLGFVLYFGGLAGNIVAENKLFSLRRGAAKRKAKSEGKATVTYDKVYTIPPAEGVFSYVLYPHYVLEWFEWTGFWVLGGAWGLGWGNRSAALWFVINEIVTMLPRAYDGKFWYEGKFGKRAVAGRAGAIPVLGL